ncbi:MAG: DsbC family protein [Pseudomonadota bacterium]|jgi:thiol:disulfide interchange protein DsbC
MMKKLVAALVVALLAVSALANEAAVKKAVEAKLNFKVDGVRRTPYLGLYEVTSGSDVIYTDEKVTYFFAGNVIDVATKKNLTQERVRQLSAIKFSDLPLENAVKMVRGNGKRVIATFEDPNCTYCKRLAKDLATMDNVTIYTFLYPILSQDSYDKAKAVWCAADRGKAWQDLMVQGTAPAGKGDCDTPLEKNLALGQKLKVTGTPTIFLTNGERVPGAVPLAELEQMLAKAGGGK